MLALPVADLWVELERRATETAFLVVDRDAASGGAADLPAIPAQPGLVQHLRDQIGCLDLDPEVAGIAAYLAGDLDARGFLPDSDDDLAAETGAPATVVAAARAALQSCDPTGVGARDLGDCIRLQLVEGGAAPEEAERIRANLRPLADGQIAVAAARLGVSVDAAAALARRIARLNPDPAAAFAGAAPVPLLPELAVRVGPDGGLSVTLLDDPAAGVRVEEDLARRVLARGAPSERAFIRAQLDAARRLTGGVAFRSRTLLRVGRAMAEAQSAYFLGRARSPAPLARAEIAAQLGLHASTVGRAIRDRGLLFDGRVRPLSWFFPSGGAAADGGPLSPQEVQARIRDLVSREGAGAVLSDAEIAARLAADGVDIARRTVAKYRSCLGIPTSSDRRRILAKHAGQPAPQPRRAAP
ncbi:MAG: hypothetical protein GVY27_02620 [Deinococcus-Thermus bacterium]|nr:hypothetical protein [Deinococcota bacterium]